MRAFERSGDGFRCVACGAITRTERGMIIHLGVSHGIRRQDWIDGVSPDNAPGDDDLPRKA